MNEIVFELSYAAVGRRFTASATTVDLYVESASLEELEQKMCDAVRSHFADQSNVPRRIVALAAGREFRRISLE
jgi:hypothetical protein